MPVIPEFRRLRPEDYRLDSRRDGGGEGIKRGNRGKEKMNLFLYFIAIV